VNCKDPKKPSTQTCDMKKLDNSTWFNRLANELVMEIVQQAINKCLIPQSEYALIEAGEDRFYTSGEMIKHYKQCTPK